MKTIVGLLLFILFSPVIMAGLIVNLIVLAFFHGYDAGEGVIDWLNTPNIDSFNTLDVLAADSIINKAKAVKWWRELSDSDKYVIAKKHQNIIINYNKRDITSYSNEEIELLYIKTSFDS